MITVHDWEDRFLPYRTMFKLPVLQWFTRLFPLRLHAICVRCECAVPLADLLGGELEEDQCPHCKTTAKEYWANIPSRPVPEYD